MPHRPKFFLILSLIFIATAILFPVQIMLLYDYSFQDLPLIFNKISAINFLVIAALALNVPLLLKASPELKKTLPLTILLVTWNNYVVGSYAHDFSMTTTTLSTLGFCLMFSPLLTTKYLSLLNNPQLRWWMRAPRLKANLQTQISPYVGRKLAMVSYDISETGIFVPFMEEAYDTLNIGDMATLNIKLSQFQNIKCEAQVVRITKEKGNYPTGMGLQFVNMEPKFKTELKGFVEMEAH